MKFNRLIQSHHLHRRGIRLRRVLSRMEAAALTPFELAFLREHHGIIPPIAGADGEDDAGDGDGDGDDGDGDADGDGDDGDGDDGAGDGDDGDGDGDGDDDDGDRLTKAEAERLRQRVAAAEKARRKAERKLSERTQGEAEDAGEFEKLYKDEQAAHAETRSTIAEKLKDAEIVSQAQTMGFRNPKRVVRLIEVNTEDVVDDDFDVDEKAIERELKKLAKSDAYLLRRRSSQTDADERDTNRRRRRTTTPARNGATDEWDPRASMRSGYEATTPAD